MKRLIISSLGVFMVCFATIAQTDKECAALFLASLNNTLFECAGLEADVACYGNNLTLGETLDDIEFAVPGDEVDIASLQSLQTIGMDKTSGKLGFSVIELETARLVLQGNVELENLGAGVVTAPFKVTYPTGANARRAPSTDATLARSLITGQIVLANGRLQDNSWLRVELPDFEVGWVLSSLVRPEAGTTFEALPVISPTDDTEYVYRPLYASQLVTGYLDEPCGAAPESGILIQTPEDESVTLLINEASLTISGTSFLQALSNETLIIHNLEGTAEAVVKDRLYTIPTGSQLDTSANPTISLYNYARVEMLPYELLPRTIMVANNWESVLIPARVGALNGLTAESPCTVTVTSNVNVRSGPGRDFPARGSMLANQSALATGRAEGTDAVWWRIAPGAWLRFDVVYWEGACESLPTIEDLPRLPVQDS